MPAHLIAIAVAVILFILPLQPCAAAIDKADQDTNSKKLDIPSALDDAFLDDLPFAQRRQILREEVQTGGSNNMPLSASQKYNLLIR